MSLILPRSSFSKSLHLLDPKDRKVVFLVIIGQSFLALLDLLGVALLGLVVGLLTTMVTGIMPSALIQILTLFDLNADNVSKLIVVIAPVAATLLILKSVASFFITRSIFQFLATKQAVISGKLTEQLLAKPLLFVQELSSQETSYALTKGANAATIGVIGNTVVIFSELFLIVLLLIGLSLIDPLLTAFTLLFFGSIAFGLHRLMSKRAGRLGSESFIADVASIESVQEAILSYRELSVTNRRGLYAQKFQNLRTKASHIQADLEVMNQVSKYVFEVMIVVGGGLLAVSQLITRDVSSAIAIVSIFLLAATRMSPSLLRLQAGLLLYKSAAGTAISTFLLASKLKFGSTQSPSNAIFANSNNYVQDTDHSGFNPEVYFQDVSFRYPESSQMAVNRVNFGVKSGSSFALVGSSGSGKSTIADLLLGVLIPDEGIIQIGGLSPDEVIKKWPGAINYVPQEIHLINGTILENIALGLPQQDIDIALANEALERSKLTGFVSSLPDGIQTLVGEHGSKLSGGQKQRLGLARALYSKPKLIILDEATSALDSITEREITEIFAELKGEVTVITIAHRLATIRDYQQIIFLENGHIRGKGSFEELKKAVPEFRQQAHNLGL